MQREHAARGGNPYRRLGAIGCQHRDCHLGGRIKGNVASKIYHLPQQQDYAKTRANVQCFDTESAALAAGYRGVRR